VTNITVGNAPRKIAVQTAPAKQASSSRRITISGFTFAPATLKVNAGETVTWINDDGAPHSVAIKDGMASDTLMPTKSYSVKFEETGDYDYLCSIHPYMTGKIVVTDDGHAVTSLPIK
jgi:amicyanin